MSEDKGLVPNRRVIDTPVGAREMLGPYDIDFERQEQIEALMQDRDKIMEAQDGAAARAANAQGPGSARLRGWRRSRCST